MNLVIEKQNAWFDLTKIKVTPTILIDGYQLLDPYKLEDIKHLLP
ncbi:MAG: hypothetical protein V4663_03335 [Bacteroidota bacterium]